MLHIEVFNDDHVFKCLDLAKVKLLSDTRSKVYLAIEREKPHEKKVVKVFRNTESSFNSFINEIEMVKKLKHPNIMMYDRAVAMPKYNILVMPYCERGGLYKRVGRISQRETDRYFLQMCGAIKYLHGLNIVHRDIKLDNFLLDAQHQLHLTDFEMACRVKPGCPTVHLQMGTLQYMAPEMLAEPEGSYNGFKLDIYALGVALWCILFEKDSQDIEDYLGIARSYTGRYPCIFYKWILENVLHPDPELRWDISQLIQGLCRSWLEDRAKAL
ncbi:sperm motility kinase Y-like [Physella acuta]|uniref:sperm motility kinase Y-like n=1 Tax=Physella acuta TaxID=109671 RepID=UPI0027DB9339|nr:sperm motility kinase Y-like [Physella acuta]